MSRSYIPTKDALLLSWSSNFKTLITASPTTYNLTAAQATAYTAAHTAYATAYATAIEPSTRTHPAITAKNAARAALKTQIRALVKFIDASATVTGAQREALGLNVRKTPSPRPIPSEPPMLEIIERYGTTIIARLHDATGERRGKPNDVAGARVYSYIGATPPASVSDWKYEGSTSQTKVEIEFPVTTPPGAKVYLTAFWVNFRNQAGPGCAPVETNIAGGAMREAA